MKINGFLLTYPLGSTDVSADVEAKIKEINELIEHLNKIKANLSQIAGEETPEDVSDDIYLVTDTNNAQTYDPNRYWIDV